MINEGYFKYPQGVLTMTTWDELSTMFPTDSGDSQKSDLFLKLTHGKHRIRLVGEAKPVRICWDSGKKLILPDGDEGSVWEQKLKAMGLEVRSNIVINVFDRNDTEDVRVKILEKGTSVFKSILVNYENTKVHPGGTDGHEWIIIAEVPSDPRRTKYTVTSLGPSPFTEAEKVILKREKLHRDNPEQHEAEFGKLPKGQKGLIDLDDQYGSEKALRILEEHFSGKEINVGAEKVEKAPETATAGTSSISGNDGLDGLF
jgi:hypothetical protein